LRMDAARPGPDADGAETTRVDVDEDDIAGGFARFDSEAQVAQGIVERTEQADQPGPEYQAPDEQRNRDSQLAIQMTRRVIAKPGLCNSEVTNPCLAPARLLGSGAQGSIGNN